MYRLGDIRQREKGSLLLAASPPPFSASAARSSGNLLKRAGDRVVAAVPAQPSGYRPEMPGLSY